MRLLTSYLRTGVASIRRTTYEGSLRRGLGETPMAGDDRRGTVYGAAAMETVVSCYADR